jgi:hypothetical protein
MFFFIIIIIIIIIIITHFGAGDRTQCLIFIEYMLLLYCNPSMFYYS